MICEWCKMETGKDWSHICFRDCTAAMCKRIAELERENKELEHNVDVLTDAAYAEMDNRKRIAELERELRDLHRLDGTSAECNIMSTAVDVRSPKREGYVWNLGNGDGPTADIYPNDTK